MGCQFCVYSSHKHVSSSPRSELTQYLRTLHNRISNAIHAETRIYTCKTPAREGNFLSGYELHWNEDFPDEIRLGSFNGYVDSASVNKIEAKFIKGQPVRLFTFDSDAELRFEEVLVPVK